jgi:hypothetical protein
VEEHRAEEEDGERRERRPSCAGEDRATADPGRDGERDDRCDEQRRRRGEAEERWLLPLVVLVGVFSAPADTRRNAWKG